MGAQEEESPAPESIEDLKFFLNFPALLKACKLLSIFLHNPNYVKLV